MAKRQPVTTPQEPSQKTEDQKPQAQDPQSESKKSVDSGMSSHKKFDKFKK